MDYQKGKIYKIEAPASTNQVYIGSTCLDRLCQRMGSHRMQYRYFTNGQCHFVSSFDILRHPDAVITLIEDYPCDSKDQLNARERQVIEQHPNAVNRNRPFVTDAERKASKANIAHARSRVLCECGEYSTYQHLARHKTTDKHVKFMDMKIINEFLDTL